MEQVKKQKEFKKSTTEQDIEVLLEDQEKVLESIKEYQNKIVDLEKQSQELQDNALRAMAEAENIKKRTEKEIQDIKKYALSSFVESLVPIIENMYRSTEHITDEQRKDINLLKVIEGIEMTQVDFIKILEKQGVKRIMPEHGDIFDHNLHQAISTISDKNVKPNSISKVIQAGYTINDRLIRPALVVVNN
jgi:molecular chaperone GrpE